MAHFAQIDEAGTVTRVVVVSNSRESIGAEWCSSQYGGRWIQTSYHRRIRKNYAGIGYTYDESRDAFVPPKPYPSWVLDEESCNWKAPVDMPEGDGWVWDENSIQWIRT